MVSSREKGFHKKKRQRMIAAAAICYRTVKERKMKKKIKNRVCFVYSVVLKLLM
jgi:hypothetical protein